MNNIYEYAKNVLTLFTCTENCKLISFKDKETFQAKHCPKCFTTSGIISEMFSIAKSIHGTFYLAGWKKGLQQKENKCDCGAIKARTTHAHWCTTKKVVST